VAYAPVLGEIAQELFIGGPEVAGATLLRFYVLHIYVIPAALTVLLAVHLWRVRKDGFAAADPEGEPPPPTRHGAEELHDGDD
jgi:quinol-cytochrome oxidoreductase complex cytochrome b subunit